MRIAEKQKEKYYIEQKFKPSTTKFMPFIIRKCPGYYQTFLVNFSFINQAIGINFRLQKDWAEIASYTPEKIKATIEYMKFVIATSRRGIYNRLGWFRQALRDNYYLDFDPNQPSTQTRIIEAFHYLQDKVLDITGSLPKKLRDCPPPQGIISQ